MSNTIYLMAIKVTGLTQLINKLSEKNIKNISDKMLKLYVKDVVDDARSNAPSITISEPLNGGSQNIQSTNVGQSISGSVQNGQVEIVVSDPQAPYIEFGTGRFAAQLLGTYPKEWKEIAFEYYINGKGNMHSQPFLYPAIIDNEFTLEKELQIQLDKI